MRFLVCLLTLFFVITHLAYSADKPRLVVTTDIGGDPDDQHQPP